MKRLTEKSNDGNFTCKCGWNYFEYGDGDLEIFNKLGHLEDLEDELGISLEVLFKALKEGIWSTVIVNRLQKENQIRKFKNVSLKLFEEDWGLVELIQNFDENLTGTLVLLKDYGDTWALTREELE